MESSFSEGTLLWIVLFPLLGALLNGTVGCFFNPDRRVVGAVAIGAVFLSFALAVYAFVELLVGVGADETFALTQHVYEWFSIEAGPSRVVPINVRFLLDPLSGIMLLMVTGIGLLIHIYSLGYMSDEPSFARFFAYLNLFMASMLVLVLASNLPLMFVGWEGVGLCSYLLIGFWFENPSYAAAGKKAFIVNRIGDFGVLMGMFVLVAAAGSFEFVDINRQAPSLSGPLEMGGLTLSASVATVAALFLFLGCTGKSAQIPLFVWLPDAMAGPTPVSALIHAATMVTSGVYLCCRLSPVFVQSPTAMAVIAVVGTATALLAASIALVQNQLKKVLAYSTVSQLGFMFAAVGVGAFNAGIFHVFTHAFFKACLFLGAGSVMHAVHAHGDADLGALGGMRKWMPTTRWTFLASCCAIAGLPLFAGFFSKDMILHGALGAGAYFPFAPWLGWVLFFGLVVAGFGTAFYMFRLYFLTFTGAFRGDAHHGEPHESERVMTAPLVLLALGAIGAGFLGMPAWLHLPDLWSAWLLPVVAGIPGAAEHHHDATSGALALAFGALAGLGGTALAWLRYRDKSWQPAARLSPVHRLLMDKWRVDELYERTLVGPLRGLAQVSGNIDKIVVDGLTKLTGSAVRGCGFLFTRLQTGSVHTYGTAVSFGIVVVLWWALFPHPHIDVATKGEAAHFVAGAGMGYQYRWDFDSDGQADTAWGADQRDVTYAFETDQLVGVELTLIEVAGRHPGPYSVRLREGEGQDLSPRHLGDGWRINPHSRRPPHVRLADGQVLVRPGASSVRVDGTPASGDDIPVQPGSTIQLGMYTKLRVDGVVRSTLFVRSAFGNVAKTQVDVVVQPRQSARRAGVRPRAPDSRFAQRGAIR